MENNNKFINYFNKILNNYDDNFCDIESLIDEDVILELNEKLFKLAISDLIEINLLTMIII